MKTLLRLLNWWSGWRVDHDGWLVRAGRRGDPPVRYLDTLGIRGFYDENGAVYVAEHEGAHAVDQMSRMRLDRREG